MKRIRQAFIGLGRLIYPKPCPSCHRGMMQWEVELCNVCWAKISYIELHAERETLLQERLAGRVNLLQAHAMMRFYQGGMSRQILQAIKYKGKSSLAGKMGKVFGDRLENILTITPDSILVPVPLHPLKMQMRGFNQSEKIADGLGEVLSIPVVADGLERVQFHVSQTKKGKEARWEQIKNDFRAKKEKVSHRDIILVDDVCTSGATIEACAKALQENDIKSISLLTLAVAGDNYR